MFCAAPVFSFFFFNDTATTEIYTLSLHDALPISRHHAARLDDPRELAQRRGWIGDVAEEVRERQPVERARSEEHTSELQSQSNLVCRLLLEKKKRLRKSSRRTPRRPSTCSSEASR